MGPAPIVVAIVVGGVLACGIFVATGIVVVPIVINKLKLRVRYKKGKSYIEISQDTDSFITEPGSFIDRLIGDTPKWKKITLTQQDKEIFQQLTTQEFILKCEVYRCPMSQQVMREPVGMSCCQGIQLGEKISVQYFVKNKKSCPFCGSKDKSIESIIYKNNHISMAIDGIEGLRKQLKITFRRLSGDLLKQFQEKVNQQFGKNYSQKYVVRGDSDIFSSDSTILE